MRDWAFWRRSSANLTYPSDVSTGQCFQFLKHTFACGNVAKPWRIPRNCNRLQILYQPCTSAHNLSQLLMSTVWCAYPNAQKDFVQVQTGLAKVSLMLKQLSKFDMASKMMHKDGKAWRLCQNTWRSCTRCQIMFQMTHQIAHQITHCMAHQITHLMAHTTHQISDKYTIWLDFVALCPDALQS